MNPYTLRNEDFIQIIDVVCPKCNGRALVVGGTPYGMMSQHEDKVRFACASCGYALKYGSTPKLLVYVNSNGIAKYSRVLAMNGPCDPFFEFDVWYRLETTYGLLWAYNLDHLEVIESYIANRMRTRNGVPNQNNSIASRLPQWAKEAKNRDYLIKQIKKFKLK